ncbi:osteopetrosis-associated transmembrane protein 1 [Drosophila montana]|uniref:osteopetrosis-associated transmembrane protein 1 n=1 Tax=Drosophila montana TaxID=40370 RepID=UPI00313CFF36
MRNIFLLIIVCCITLAAQSKNCVDLLRELANAQQHFVYCNTRHAVPDHPKDERLCIACNQKYSEMASSYDTLMKNENCSKIYMDSDRMNIVFTTQNVLKGLWNRASCEECFKGNNSDNFQELYLSLSSCLEVNKGSECTNCLLKYITINDFYKNLDQKSNGKVCFDMQDVMNRTRVLWSKDLKCCQREVKMTAFLTSVAIVAVLPILLFYSAAFVLTKRREANHGLLNEQEPELDAPSTSAIITAAILSTQTEPPAVLDARIETISNLLALNDPDSSSDDDQPLTKAKTS